MKVRSNVLIILLLGCHCLIAQNITQTQPESELEIKCGI